MLYLFYLLLLTTTSVYSSTDFDEPLESLTLESFSQSAYTDHVLAFNEVFQIIPPKSFLEFGLGRSTKFFLDKCPIVASLELTSLCTASLSFPWYKQCTDKFINSYDNWRPSLRFCSPLMNTLTRDGKGGVPSPDVEAEFLKEINSITKQGLTLIGNDCSIAFVDSGTAGRVDIVNALLAHKIPIVAAHDTKSFFYHWERIHLPKEYVAFVFPAREGITFWIDSTRFDKETLDRVEKAKVGLQQKLERLNGITK
jgi:hypothetical protein